ncbi:uncharacterized protein [Clytia hemisphaerica]|uniref:uncharacterized protein n=1 Tax=Clytia hemisphaerica TaxID=252671 RepID=UPI0034D59478
MLNLLKVNKKIDLKASSKMDGFMVPALNHIIFIAIFIILKCGSVDAGAPPIPGSESPPIPGSEAPPIPGSFVQTEVSINNKATELYLRNAKSFSGTKIKMVAGVYMVTECVLLCEKDENCDFSVLDDMQNCTLYSTKTNNKTTDQNATDINVGTDTQMVCSSIAFKKRSDSTTFDKASTTKFCTAKYSYETKGCYNRCGGKTGWCTKYCGVNKACCRAHIPEQGDEGECAILNNGYDGQHKCALGVTYGELGNKTYVFVGFKRSFSSARQKCSTVGGDLVSIESPHEFYYINNHMENHVEKGGYYLVGYKKKKGADNWHWVDDDDDDKAYNGNVWNFEIPLCSGEAWWINSNNNTVEWFGRIRQKQACLEASMESRGNFVCQKKTIKSFSFT